MRALVAVPVAVITANRAPAPVQTLVEVIIVKMAVASVLHRAEATIAEIESYGKR